MSSLWGWIRCSLAAKRANTEDINRLKLALERVLHAAERGDFEATVEKDFEFHRLIWEISGHRLFIKILDNLESQIRMFMAVQAPLFAHLIDSVKDHLEIVNAIASGDSETAARAAHSLKGSVANFRATRAFDMALTLESTARRGDLKAARETWAGLQGEVSRLKASLEQLVAGAESCES